MNNNYNNENNGVNNNSQMGYNPNNLNHSNANFNGSQRQQNNYVNSGQVSSQSTTSQVNNGFNQQFNLNSNNQVNNVSVNANQTVSNITVQSNNINNNTQYVNNNINSQSQQNTIVNDKFCGKCGAKLSSTDLFCGVCGERVNSGQTQPTTRPLVDNVNSNTNNNYNTGAINDEELRRAYIGNKYSDFKDGGLSWLAFFFSFYYLLYRKMYLFGFLWLFGSIISIFFPFFQVLLFGLQIFMLIKFKDLYIKHVDNKINKIKIENSNVSRSQLVDICARKGGTSVGFLVLTFVIVFLSMIFITTPIIMGIIDDVRNDNNLDGYDDNNNYYEENNNSSNSDNGLVIIENCSGKNKVVANVKNGNIVLSGKIENKKYNKTLDIGNVDKIEVVSTDSCDQFTLVYIDTNNYLYRIDMTYDS